MKKNIGINNANYGNIKSMFASGAKTKIEEKKEIPKTAPKEKSEKLRKAEEV